jgi:hypothetical protein
MVGVQLWTEKRICAQFTKTDLGFVVSSKWVRMSALMRE